jgi:hypothetical protein
MAQTQHGRLGQKLENLFIQYRFHVESREQFRKERNNFTLFGYRGFEKPIDD